MWIQNTKMNIFVIKHKQIIEKVPRNYSILKEHYIAYSHSILLLKYIHEMENIKANGFNCNFFISVNVQIAFLFLI